MEATDNTHTAYMALKEWAVVVEIMGSGRQILTLRKGGIHPSDKNFRVLHKEFLLYPTYEHQRQALLKAEHRTGLSGTFEGDSIQNTISMRYWCRVTDFHQIDDPETLAKLAPYHSWTNQYAEKRLHWRPKQPLTVAFMRIYRLRKPVRIDLLDKFEGCKSWVELGQQVGLGKMDPVLDDSQYYETVGKVKNLINQN